MKIGLIVGHNNSAQGAILREENISEYAFWFTYVHYVVLPIVKSYGHDVKVIRRSATKSYSAQIEEVHKLTNDCELIISFHFNAVADRNVNGFEVLYSGNNKSGEYAKKMLNCLDSNLPLNKRGVKIVNRVGMRGYQFLKYGKAHALIVEPFFGSCRDFKPADLYGMRDAFEEFFGAL